MYTNRDLSWLEFNERIIQQVTLDIPLMEKVNMLSISASNLDEFIMVRLSKLMFKTETEPCESDFDEIRYKDLLKTLKKKVKNFKKLQLEVYNYLLEELAKENKNPAIRKNAGILSSFKKSKTKFYLSKSLFIFSTPITIILQTP